MCVFKSYEAILSLINGESQFIDTLAVGSMPEEAKLLQTAECDYALKRRVESVLPCGLHIDETMTHIR